MSKTPTLGSSHRETSGPSFPLCTSSLFQPYYTEACHPSPEFAADMTTSLPAGLSATYWRLWRSDGRVHDSLQPGEEWIGTWDGLGLYESNNKIPKYQSLLFHLTTHRLLLEPIPDPSAAPSSSSRPSSTPGLSANLQDIRQTEFYTGFMRSSAKITLSFGPVPGQSDTKDSTDNAGRSIDAEGEGWTCGVCGFRNAGPEVKCGLCGVGKDRVAPSRTGTPVPTGLSTVQKRASMTTPIPPDSSGASTAAGSDTAAKNGARTACPACTFLNHPSMTSCEICSTPLPRASSGQANGNTSQTLVAAKAEEGKMEIVRLSFRKGGEKVAYAKLKSVLGQKAWERQDGPSRRSTADANGVTGTSTPRPAGGIDGILQTMSLDAKNRSENVSSAFADLEVLMVRAGEMVKMAQSLNDKLLAQQRSNPAVAGADKVKQEEEATLIRTSLVQLGLPAPALTSDMVRSDREYLDGLARELGALLAGDQGKGKGKEVEALMVGRRGRGVIGLDEVWGLWMRARGVALLSPSTLVSILPFIPDQTSPPIRLRTLPSGLKVLFSPTYSPPNILSRILELLSPASDSSSTISASDEPGSEQPVPIEKSLSLIEVAAYEGLAIGLAKELMEEIEKIDTSAMGRGGVYGIVRDDQAEQGAGGVRWYRDLISSWTIEA